MLSETTDAATLSALSGYGRAELSTSTADTRTPIASGLRSRDESCRDHSRPRKRLSSVPRVWSSIAAANRDVLGMRRLPLAARAPCAMLCAAHLACAHTRP
jgi:hypothetical protein